MGREQWALGYASCGSDATFEGWWWFVGGVLIHLFEPGGKVGIQK